MRFIVIKRMLEKNVVKKFFKGKAILILGPRQVGKTTLVKYLTGKFKDSLLFLNGDEADAREFLTNTTSSALKKIIGKNKVIVIDEAQRIENIGLTLKLLVENFPSRQIIATGSSSFELSNKINEPLTGRKFEYHLYPLSFHEMSNHTSFLEERRLLEHRLIYGYYPEVVTSSGEEKDILRELSGSYLYKDIFSFEQIKKPMLLEKLLQALALQIGSEVTYQELGRLVGADCVTVERYIDLLEKTFVIFKLPSLSRNIRNEIKKGRKIYFYDCGIRNAIIKSFNPLSMRQDVGTLWENFLISERIKSNHYSNKWVNAYFWRNHAQQEIDYIEEYEGKFHAYEFKWNPKKKAKFSKSFINGYPDSDTEVISTENFDSFVF